MAAALKVHQLGKCYRLGTDAPAYDTLREALTRFVRPREVRSEVWAVRDLTFEVTEGEAVGIIGRNGAGKTTLLKLLAGITEPTTGEAHIRGRVGALLDVGTGFHPELTGRENVYLSGALLGMRRDAVSRRFSDIVEFAGVERFLDTPVKRYSAGMRMRLAFAVAAHIEPPILIVDEVLAVGDAAFRDRCIGKIAEIGGHGRTVLFVSHDLGAVTRLCSRVLWLADGRVFDDGPARSLVSAYLQDSVGKTLSVDFGVPANAKAFLRKVRICDEHGGALTAPPRDKAFVVEIAFELRSEFPGLDFGVVILDADGRPVLDDALSDWVTEERLAGPPGVHTAHVTIPPVLAAGSYSLTVWVGNDFETLVHQPVLTLPIAPLPDDRQEWSERARVVQPPVVWRVERTPLESGG